MNVIHSDKITNYINSIPAIEYALNDLTHSNEYNDSVYNGLCLEGEQNSYADDLEYDVQTRLTDSAIRSNFNIYEVILSTDDDIYVMYFLGHNEDDMLEDLKNRVDGLMRAD